MEYINTFNNKIVHSNINPIRRDVISTIIHIDSSFRNNYNSSISTNFEYNFPYTINDVVSVKLDSIDIPSAWYLINSTNNNNKFIIEISNNTTKEEFEIIVPNGSYSIDDLVSYLNTNYFYLNSSSDPLLQLIQFSVDDYTLKSNIKFVDGTSNHSFSINFDVITNDCNTSTVNNSMNKLGWIMGFRKLQYNNETNITSEALFDAGGNRYIYFCINDYQNNRNNNNIAFFNHSLMNQNILGKIYLYNGKFSLNIYETDNNTSKKITYFGPTKLSKIGVKLYDKFGEIIDLNNMDFSFSLELEILYNDKNI